MAAKNPGLDAPNGATYVTVIVAAAGTKQPGVKAPDGSTYVSYTDGNGNRA